MVETKRLILRPFQEGDEEDLYEYLKEPEVHCFACMKLSDLEAAKKGVLERAKDGELYFAIVEKSSGKVIGEINAYPETSQPDAAENVQRDLPSAYIAENMVNPVGTATSSADFCPNVSGNHIADPKQFHGRHIPFFSISRILPA